MNRRRAFNRQLVSNPIKSSWSITMLPGNDRVRARALNSEAILACDYDYGEGTVTVHFAGGNSYEYLMVARPVWVELMRSEDGPGAAVNRLLVRADPPFSYRKVVAV